MHLDIRTQAGYWNCGKQQLQQQSTDDTEQKHDRSLHLFTSLPGRSSEVCGKQQPQQQILPRPLLLFTKVPNADTSSDAQDSRERSSAQSA
jgi:hypothetical protein